MSHETPEEIVIVAEQGRGADGQSVSLDRRLYLQLLVFDNCTDSTALNGRLQDLHLPYVLYNDLNNPSGVGLLTYSEDPLFFATTLRTALQEPLFRSLTPLPEFTMIGRTYALGYETDLEASLIRQPMERVCNPAWPWAIWYPLRRSGAFEQLSAAEQRIILAEHGGIGRAYSRAGHGSDVRLACHGLDKNDNDFVIGLLGPSLHPLSLMVQRMRKTKQTSLYLERLGPFFVGHAIGQNLLQGEAHA